MEQSRRELSVLYVEDEPLARRLVATMLEREVGVLHQAADGAAGLQLFQEHRPDIVITDIRMPVMNGIEMARRIRELDRETFVIVTTAHSDAELLIEAIAAGVSHYILKPIDYPRLSEAVGRCLDVITLRKERAREQELRLQLSERLSTLGQLASGIAHELNNPLASISGCTEALLQRVRQERYDPALFESYLTLILDEVWRCGDITKGMLSIVRQSSYERKLVDINEAVDKALQIIGFQGKMLDVRVVREFAAGLPPVHANEGELRQVLLALFTNALDAMAFRGTLTVATRAEGDGVAIAVTDTGCGIPPELREKIFDSFFTTKTHEGGTGLGLPIALRIVTAHRGRIEVISREGEGTSFVVHLPVGAPDAGAAVPSP